MRHFLNIADVSQDDVSQILNRAQEIKISGATVLKDKSVGLIFEKPSNRTRLSFEVGIRQLGGQSIYIQGAEVQIGTREPVSHVSRVMSRYFDAIVYRTKNHQYLSTFARHASIPVINGLSDVSHPCQAMADALTIKDHFKSFEGVFLTYIGDGNNVCQSLMAVAEKCGFQMAVVCPKAYQPKKVPDGILVTDRLEDVIHKSNVIYTDVWVSMGDESESEKRQRDFLAYQVNASVMSQAQPSAIFLHCLPAHLGQEVSEDVFESDASKVFDQAENRLHAQNAILEWVMKG